MSEKKKSSPAALLVRIAVIVAIGGAAIYWRYSQRQAVLAENERRQAVLDAAQAAGAEVIIGAPQPAEPTFQKTPQMLRADALAAEVDEMERRLADAKKQLADMDTWLKNYEETTLRQARDSGDAASLEEANRTYQERLERRNAHAARTAQAEETLVQRKVELTNLRMDIITSEL